MVLDVRCRRRVLAAVCWVQRAGCSALGAACSVQRARCSVLRIQRAQGTACRVLGAACSGYRVHGARCTVQGDACSERPAVELAQAHLDEAHLQKIGVVVTKVAPLACAKSTRGSGRWRVEAHGGDGGWGRRMVAERQVESNLDERWRRPARRRARALFIS